MADSENPIKSWYRVCLNTIVRKDKDLSSERLRILPMGSRVYVTQIIGRRVQIQQPIQGWCSLESSNGDKILSPLEAGDKPMQTPTQKNIEARREKLNTATGDDKPRLKQELEDMERALSRKENNIKNLINDVKQAGKNKAESQVYGADEGDKQNLRLGDVVWLEKKELGMGIVRYIGPVWGQGRAGTWVGVEFETPIGDSDGKCAVPPNGEMGGFENAVAPKHAAFVRAEKVKLITGFDWLEIFLKLEQQIKIMRTGANTLND